MRRTEAVTSPGGLARTRYAADNTGVVAISTGTNTGTGASPRCAIAKSVLGALTAFW